MANATIASSLVSKPGDTRAVRVQTVDIQGDFQNISSHIYPDISSFISVRQSHHALLSSLTQPVDLLSLSELEPDYPSPHSFPLLLPLTVGVEIKQTVNECSPRLRSLCLSIDSISIMLNVKDISLISSLLQKWNLKPRQRSKNTTEVYGYEVAFEDAKLGLGLRKTDKFFVVDHVEASAGERLIKAGDILYAVNNTILSTTATMTLSDIVDYLASLPRPLTVSFARQLALSSVPEREETEFNFLGNEIDYGSSDKFDLTLARGTMTFMEDDVTLLRANVTKTEIGLQRKTTCDSMYAFRLQSNMSFNYYNLRAWAWEPLLEPGVIILTANYQNPNQGSRELSIELSDRHEPLCINLTDAGVESISRLGCWAKPVHRKHSDDQTTGLPHGEAQEEMTVAHRAASAALQFAQRQKHENANSKPFVIRNRSGCSIAFVLQRHSKNCTANSQTAFGATGGYPGLREYSQAEVRVLDSDSESKFYVDIVSDESKASGRRFPFLTISIQATGDFALDPVCNLDISQPGETLVPLFDLLPDSLDTLQNIHNVKHWASWRVEQTVEKTNLTFGGPIQLVSSLRETVEIGLTYDATGSEHDQFASIGKCGAGDTLFLPLWLGLRRCSWSCVGRLNGEPDFTHLFGSSDNLNRLHGKYIELVSDKKDSKPSRFVSLSINEANGAFSISIDCCISYRNLLPTNIEWRVTCGLPPEATTVDSSSLSVQNSTGDEFLRSGELTEIFSRGYEGLYTQVRIVGRRSWSSWVSLSVSNSANSAGGEAPLEFRNFQILDAFDIPLNLGLRIARKGGCIDVVLFAEIWCANFTSLPLVFGCPKHEILRLHEEKDEGTPTDLSAAEAALREFSSLFESGASAAGPTGSNNGAVSGADVVEIHRIPEQCLPEAIEECFEYIEMEALKIKRSWWAGENPNAPRKPISQLETTDGWRWLSDAWVS
jgi:hypothetical protein